MPLIPAILLVVLMTVEPIYEHLFNLDMIICDKMYANIEVPAL